MSKPAQPPIDGLIMLPYQVQPVGLRRRVPKPAQAQPAPEAKMQVWDCLHCGATYWEKGEPPDCACGDALVLRRDPKFKPDFALLFHD